MGFLQPRAAIGIAILALLSALPGALADELCATSPLDTPPPGGGIVNTYYPGTAPGQLAPGTTDIPVGSAVGAPPIAAGDMLLIIQMQDATINAQNDDRYGDFTQGDGVGSGMLDPREVGKFEYVVAMGPVASGIVPVQGKGPDLDGAGGNPPGIINTYTNADATATEGQRRYQVIRVPRYATLDMTSVGGSITPAYWNGSTGGVLAIEVVGALTLSDTNLLDAAGRGFRGGLGQNLQGTTGATSVDYRYASLAGFNATGAHGNKGEGIAGTPRYLRNPATGGNVETGAEGYPDGSRARGAPGNAGGGGTDGKPSSNNDSAGGGGGGNGGPGGRGGNCASGSPGGGHGGAAFTDPTTGNPLWGPGRLVMGGGAGSGSKHDNSPDESGGGAGGGLILIRTGSLAGTGTIDARGETASDTGNDGGGGGGAGGSVLLVTKNSDLTGVTLTVDASGGDGSDAGSGTSVLGPGGGGGGGVVLMNAYTNGTVTVTTDSGLNGTTDSPPIPNGSTSGTVGTPPPSDPPSSNPFIDPTLVPGADSAADCEGNGAPVNTVPGAQQTLINSPLVFSTANGNVISTWDPDSDPDDVQVTLTVTSGTLTLDAGALAALTSVVGDGTATVVLTGTWAEINDAMNPLTFTPAAAFSGSVTLQIVTDDLGNNGVGGALTDTDQVLINVADQNLAPWVNVPAGPFSTPEDTSLSFTGGTAISVQDFDSDPNDIQVVVTASDGNPATADNGTLTVDPTGTGVTSVTGNGTGQLTIIGTQSEISDCLDALVYQPPLDFSGTITLTATVDDLGWTGPMGQEATGLTDTESVTITVTPVNDIPVAAPDSYSVGRGRTLDVSPIQGVLVNDTDADGNTLTAVVDAAPAVGTLLPAADGSFTYDAPVGFVGVVTFTYHANDGAADSNIVTVTITVFNIKPKLRAGYCGLTGLEGFALLGLLALRRRLRSR
jgi:hypothetical protein